MRATLLVFLKYPEPGRVKTRLAADLGPDRAAELYRRWIGEILHQLQPLRGEVRLVGSITGAPRSAFAEWAHLVDEWEPQSEGDLGDRLAAGFARPGPVLAIGTDCLEVTAQHVREALARLSECDAVFGPASDGGYYLVGTAQHLPGFFEGIRWSSPQTLGDHLARCRERGWRVAFLPELPDIDTAADWDAHLTRRLTLAVVLPALNEEHHLAATLESLRAQTAPADRILVVDGGSLDGTVTLAGSLGAEVMVVPGRGRGGQIAAGIASTREAVILVAHADMRFPPTALAAIREFLATHPASPGGCLGHRFDSPRRVYRLMEWFDRRRARRGIAYGDQAQFFRRSALEQIGGFPDQPILEDFEVARRLQTLGPVGYLDVPVLVSPRRFERRGVLRTAWINWRLRWLYRRHGRTIASSLFRNYYRN